MVEFCVEKGLCVGNTYFKHKRLHKYTRVARGQDGGEVGRMIDLLLVKKAMDVRAVGGMGQDLSDHHVVLCKVSLVGGWIKRRAK